MELQKNFLHNLLNYYSNIYIGYGFAQDKKNLTNFLETTIKEGFCTHDWSQQEVKQYFGSDLTDFLDKYYPSVNITGEEFNSMSSDEESGGHITDYKLLSMKELNDFLILKNIEHAGDNEDVHEAIDKKVNEIDLNTFQMKKNKIIKP